MFYATQWKDQYSACCCASIICEYADESFKSWLVISLNLLVHVIMCAYFAAVETRCNVADVTQITTITRPPEELRFG